LDFNNKKELIVNLEIQLFEAEKKHSSYAGHCIESNPHHVKLDPSYSSRENSQN